MSPAGARHGEIFVTVREIRPPEDPRARDVVRAALRYQALLFEQELGRARASGGGRVTHPFFGQL